VAKTIGESLVAASPTVGDLYIVHSFTRAQCQGSFIRMGQALNCGSHWHPQNLSDFFVVRNLVLFYERHSPE
jgi:hypothetical protein